MDIQMVGVSKQKGFEKKIQKIKKVGSAKNADFIVIFIVTFGATFIVIFSVAIGLFFVLSTFLSKSLSMISLTMHPAERISIAPKKNKIP